MAGIPTVARTLDRIERLCASTMDERALRVEIIGELRRSIGFDAYVWLLTDPVTTVGNSPLAEVPALPQLPTLIKGKYSSTVNRWTTLGGAAEPARLLSRVAADADDPWRVMLKDYEIVDVASTVFRDRHGCWGFLDLWRHQSSGPFADAAIAVLVAVDAPITAALRRRQAGTFTSIAAPLPSNEGPAILLLDDDLCITAQTDAATEWLRRLLPTAPGLAPIPAAAFNVAAQLLAVEAGVDEHPAAASAYVPGFTWVTVRASRFAGTATARPGAIAVSIEETPDALRLEVYARAHALSPREQSLLRLLVRGLDTRELAQSMSISEYTVGDHLKSIFAKTGINSRTGILTAALGAHH